MPTAGFKPTIPASERLQTLALDTSATGIGSQGWNCTKINFFRADIVHRLKQTPLSSSVSEIKTNAPIVSSLYRR